MKNISKILAVFVAVASLAFVGFAVATTFGGPDWSAATDAEYFNPYKIAKAPGVEGNWVAERADGGQVATSKVYPEVITKVMDEVYQQQQTEIQELQARKPLLEAKVQHLTETNEKDEVALQTYVTYLRERLESLREAEAELSLKVTTMANDAQKIENQISSRREDVFRLRQQVEELRTDLFRLQEIQSQLKDLEFQVHEQLTRAKQREQSLKEYSPQSVDE